MRFGPRAADFVWTSGVEDTFVPQTRPGHRALDEYALMGHYEHWREDLALAPDLGVKALRWGVPWYRVEPLPGEFDWRWTDQVIPYMVEELGITPIIDLMHYGCPFWLWREFANEEYPRRVAAYAAAFAGRYGRLVRWYTPLNEPLVNASFCGMRGAWPPYMHGERGYVRLLMQLAEGIIETVQAIRQVQSDAGMVHVEATGITRTGDLALAELAEQTRLKGFIVFDLITGRVTPEHPLFDWLRAAGGRVERLESIARRAIPIDVMGLNFYPQWSTQELFVNERGKVASRAIEQDGAGFAAMVEDFHSRYGVPIMITETSARGSDEARSDWLGTSLGMVKTLRTMGIPVLGYTWFPMFTMIKWDYRWGRKPLKDYLLDLGMYRLAQHGGHARWRPTPLVAEMRDYINHPEASVGDLAV